MPIDARGPISEILIRVAAINDASLIAPVPSLRLSAAFSADLSGWLKGTSQPESIRAAIVLCKYPLHRKHCSKETGTKTGPSQTTEILFYAA
ncbi:hypothetical protein [Pacificibacter marinus]|uniref:Uncharacterized protein n=1 Tax=Pacificibacter marinus TaxID=658057 RepID=A0A1Y5SYR1_9RHOB|nr:hypothetical protein [Pacificibacter marinus]SEK85232.1 hypothetical protein SAMN04488032_107112 [Pacificibacter marinus]SLN49595.1 hypothetical protein PAM7971_02433 [Pacificibacter marinus]